MHSLELKHWQESNKQRMLSLWTEQLTRNKNSTTKFTAQPQRP